MNTTLIVFVIGLILYVGASIRQWRRLNRGDEKKRESPQSPRPQR